MPDLARELHDEVRRRVLRRVLRTDARLARMFDLLSRRLRRRFRLIGMTDEQVRQAVEEEFRAVEEELLPEVERSLERAAEEGNEAARRTLEQLRAVPPGGAAPFAASPRIPLSPDARATAAARIRGTLTRDGLSLSARYHRNHQRVAERIRRQVVASARAGEDIQRIAERVLDADDPLVRIPQHVDELRAVARDEAAGDPLARYAFERVVERWARRVQSLGQGPGGGPGAYTMRSATQRLIKELREAHIDNVDRIVDRWVLERARYQARLIARHETVEAYRDAYEEQAAENPAVKGFRWQLSPQHPRPDICDLYANQNLYGLGPGGYPPDAVPSTPHPNCLCVRVAIVDRFHTRRELARLNGEPEPPREWEVGGHETAAEWLARQPEEFQRELLGKTRYEVFRREPERVITAGGEPLPVHQVLGLPAPVRGLGPAVSARGLVEADRASMVRPFPRAPRLPSGDDGRRRRAPETPPSHPHDPILADLREGSAVSIEPIGQGVNGAAIVEFEVGGRNVGGRWVEGRKIRGVWKAARDEAAYLRPSVPEGTYYQREAALYELDRLLGGDTVVPPTITREVEDGGVGSVQHFVEGAMEVGEAPPDVYRRFYERVTQIPSVRRIFLLDIIAANDDRHGRNWLVAQRGDDWQAVAIDNGLTFPEGPAERFLWPMNQHGASRDLSEFDSDSVERLRSLSLEAVDDILRRYPGISMEARRRTLARIRALQRDPRRIARAGGDYDAIMSFISASPERLLESHDLNEVSAIARR